MIRFALSLIVAMVLVAAVAIDQIRTPDPVPPVLELAFEQEALLLDPPAASAVWFCPFGSVDGVATQHVVRIANHGERTATRAEVTLLTEDGAGPALSVEVAPFTLERVVLDDLGTFDASGVMVELIGGNAAVSHELTTPQGAAEATCTTSAADIWTFAGGSTEAGAALRFVVMNPFPEDAVIDIDLRTPIRSRQPDVFRAAVVPGRSVRVIELDEVIAAEAVVSTTITVTQGDVVVERLQTFDGVDGPSGAALQLGTPGASVERWFPAGRLHRGGDTHIVVANPGDTVAEVDVILHPLDPGETARLGLIPLELDVPPGRVVSRDIRAVLDGLGVALPFDVGIEVRAANGVPFVAERWQRQPVPLPAINDSDAGDGVGTLTETVGGGEGAGVIVVPRPSLLPSQGDGPGVEDVPLDALAAAELRSLQPDATVGLATSAGRGARTTSWILPGLTTAEGESALIAIESSGTAPVEFTVIAGGRIVRTAIVEVSTAGRALADLGASPGTTVSVRIESTDEIAVEAMVVGPTRVDVVSAVAVRDRVMLAVEEPAEVGEDS